MWAIGVCTHCGTVTAFRTTTGTAIALIKSRTYYCPCCGLFKITNISLVEDVRINRKYNELRTRHIMSRERHDFWGTEQLALEASDPE